MSAAIQEHNAGYVPDEVWQEADGCCLSYAGNGQWFAFGRYEPISLDDPSVALPLRRLLTADGQIAPERRTHNESDGG